MAGRVGILILGLATFVVSVFVTCEMWRYRELASGIAWLEDKSFDGLTLVAVGTGSTHENPRRLGPATAVGFARRVALVDAGRGVGEALRRCEIPIAQPDTVYLTSLLPENTVGLDDLALTGWNTPREHPLRVVGPAGTRALVEALDRAYAPVVEALAPARGVAPDGARLEASEAGDGFAEERDGLSVRARVVGDSPLPALAYRFEAGGRSLVVAGVNPDPERLAAFSRGAALLAAEGFFAASVEAAIASGAGDADRLRREAALHLPLERLGEVAAKAGVPTLVVTRLSPPPLFTQQYRTALDRTFHGHAVVADECEELTR